MERASASGGALDPADGQLLARVQAGDRCAFEVLYQKYSRPVFRTVLAITGERDTAEEILQETFVRLYAHAGQLDRTRPLLPWLHRVAVNQSYNWSVRWRMRLAALDHIVNRWFGGAQGDPAGDAERHELQRVVQEAIDALPFTQRVVVVLYYLQEMSLAEIAQVLDCPVGTVKSRLHYARQNLERRLSQDRRVRPEVAYETQ